VRPEPALARATLGVWLSLAVLGLVSTGLATVAYYRVIQRAGPSFLSLINYLIPAWAVVLGAVAFGEQLGLSAYLAMLLILGGVLASQSGRARPRG
jgi:drug/metabolite transporter (DMT)-like permease